MSRNAYRAAEKKIAEALRTSATELHLSYSWQNEGSEKLTELPESLGQLTQLQTLSLSFNQLTALPEWLGQLTQLQTLNLSSNQLTALPESLGQLTQLQTLNLSDNQLTALPESLTVLRLTLTRNALRKLPNALRTYRLLKLLRVWDNNLQSIPEWIGDLQSLEVLEVAGNKINSLPESLSKLVNLKDLTLGINTGNPLNSLPLSFDRLINLEVLDCTGCQFSDIPFLLTKLPNLKTLKLKNNPLNPELAAAYEQGFDAVKAYLQTKGEDQIVLNEAKLILIGEGEVGKSCLLDALRDEPWQKHDSTHGIEIKPVLVTHLDDNGSETEITLNTWDFGGQKVYRPTHQFFFSAPAVYLVVWKPREGPQQGAVEYWINTIKHRAGSDAKVLIVGTHGGPQQRQPDIDLQDLRDKFGADCVLGSFHVNSRPEHYDEANDTWSGERQGIAELKGAIANVSAALPNVGREVATSWNNVLQSMKDRSEQDPYISYEQFEELCEQEKVVKALAETYAGMLNQLGYVIYYGDDELKNFMILKPDWLAKAISFVLDDQTTRGRNGLVSHDRLTELWKKPPYDYEVGYPEELHPLFRKLMERFDISYQVVLDPASNQPSATSLIAQLVNNQPKPLTDWGEQPQTGDEEKQQICQIVEKGDRNKSGNAEGLFYRLIARLHKYSLGREDYARSVHWQRGLMLDDGYNGRALLRHIGNDIHITVRAAYPEYLLHELTKEVKWLVESPEEGWAGLRCEVMVPCIEPCGLKSPGSGLFELEKLIDSKQRGRPDYPCDASGCNEWQNIDCLLRNAPAQRQPIQANATAEENKQRLDEIRDLVAVLVQKWESGITGPRELWIEKLHFLQEQEAIASDATEKFKLKKQIEEAKQKISELQSPDDVEGTVMRSLLDLHPYSVLDDDQRRLMSQVDDQFATLMQLGLDEARNGPRLFSLTPANTKFLDDSSWTTQNVHLTLWCEHSRKPLPALWQSNRGIYNLQTTRIWLEKHDLALQIITKTLKAMLPIVAATANISISDTTYKGLSKGLDLGQKLFGNLSKGKFRNVYGDGIDEQDQAKQAQNALLRELHGALKKKDANFGGLIRVQNKRREFLWVHPQFKDEY